MTLELELQRDQPDESRMFGVFSVSGLYECVTLEDPPRSEKIKGRTAIPEGRYRITLEESPRFGPNTITIKDVPGFTGVRIHAGNTENDTEGCPLVGQERTEMTIIRSRQALAHLKSKIQVAWDAEDEIWLTIKNAAQEVIA